MRICENWCTYILQEKTNYSDTPFFPQLTFLKEEMSPDVGKIHSVMS